MWSSFWESFALLFVLLNPFLMLVYLLDLVRTMDYASFRRVLVRGALISGVVFLLFAWTSDALFTRVLHVRFSSFLVFGGTVFFLVAIRFVTDGEAALTALRGAPEHVASSIAMPFMIGPGTVSASILAGVALPPAAAGLAIVCALVGCVLGVLLLKVAHDYIRSRNEPLLARYVETIGRISALVVGTIAVEMVLRGVELWIDR